MLKVLTAIGNEYINNQLKLLNKYEIIYDDIQYQEALLEIINKKEFDILILYEKISGDIGKEKFFDMLLNTDKSFEIVLLVENYTEKNKKYYNLKGISRFIKIDDITIDLICSKIEEKNEIKTIEIKYKKNNNNEKINIPKYIGIYGTAGSGKTIISITFGVALNEIINKKVLIMDMDILTASVDTFCDIKNNGDCSLNKCIENIKRNDFTKDNLLKSLYKISKNLYIFSGNTNYYKCQNVLCEDYYNKIIEKIDILFDYIVFDMNSNLFIDATKWCLMHSNIIYCIIEGNYNSIKNVENSLFVINNVWDIDREKFKIIQNKYSKSSVEKEYIYELLKINCVGRIQYNSAIENSINKGEVVELIDKIYKNDILNILGYKTNKKKFIGGNIFDNKSIFK